MYALACCNYVHILELSHVCSVKYEWTGVACMYRIYYIMRSHDHIKRSSE